MTVNSIGKKSAWAFGGVVTGFSIANNVVFGYARRYSLYAVRFA
jgi:hypothetical protein